MTQSNRRRCPRAATRFSSQWSAGRRRDRGTVTDISAEGLSLSTSLPPGLTRRVKLFMPLPGGQTASPRLHLVKGVVVWRKKGSCGVAFSGMTRETSQALKELPLPGHSII